MGRIVVGVDGSDNSVRALQWAAEQATSRGDVLRALYVWEFPYMDVVPATLGTTLPPFADMQAGAERSFDAALERAALPPGVTVERAVLEGAPVRLLLEAAKDAEMVVLGARGHGGFLGLLTGSVTTQVVNHSPVPVVVVRA
jgi:nucleotide-binding universal stress UspA family protein